jgi:hypothetical protein
MTTRLHRLKCKFRSAYYRGVKPRFLDWYKERTYVPLVCLARKEIRDIRWDGPDGGLTVTGRYGSDEHGWSTHVRVDGDLGGWRLPPGIERIEDLPHFNSAAACSRYTRENIEWAHLQA